MSVVSRASCTVLDSARRRLGSSATDPTSPQYQRVEKPCQVLRERPSLKENWIAISTGSSDQTTYSHVSVARKNGRRVMTCSGWPAGTR